MIAMRIVYVMNILVAGYIAYSSISNPTRAASTIFENAYESTELIKLVGCLWLAITVLSALGLWKPMTFTPVFLLQLCYKGTWLIVVAIPAIRQGLSYPKSMSLFFIIWVIILPFVIPWKEWIYT